MQTAGETVEVLVALFWVFVFTRVQTRADNEIYITHITAVRQGKYNLRLTC